MHDPKLLTKSSNETKFKPMNDLNFKILICIRKYCWRIFKVLFQA